MTSGQAKSAKVDLFVSKERQARVWMLVAFTAVIGFAWERENLVSKLTSKPLFFAMDANTFYVSRLGTFEEAKLRLFAVDGQRFKEQRIHQKIEIGKIDILKQSDDPVVAAVQGQIIQAGVFDGRPFNKSKPVTVYFQLGGR